MNFKMSQINSSLVDKQKLIDDLEESYKHTLGFVPDRIHSRISLGIDTAAEMTEAVERLRAQLLEPEALDLKTSQLILNFPSQFLLSIRCKIFLKTLLIANII